MAVVVLMMGVLAATKWPFSYGALITRVFKATGASPSIGAFTPTYFPPGFIAERVQLQDPATRTPVFTAQRIRVRSSYLGLIRNQLSEIEVQGFHLAAARWSGLTYNPKAGSSIHVSRLVARDGSIDIGKPGPGHQSLSVAAHVLVLHGIGNAQTTFHFSATALKPPGQFRAEGTLGRLDAKSLNDAAVSGRWAFSEVNIGSFAAISGMLESSGRFSGSLDRLECTGEAVVPNFRVDGNPNQVRLDNVFTIAIDTAGGNIDFENVQSSFNHTSVITRGRLENDQSTHVKTLRLDAKVDHGRIEDLLLLLSREPRPRMIGPVRLSAKIQSPYPPTSFLRRLQLDGNFEIAGAVFANPKIQSALNHLSESSHGASRAQEHRDNSVVPGVLRGRVADAGGVARLSQIKYSSPGIDASLDGVFNLVNKGMNLRGVLSTTGELSDATSLFKSILLGIATPFLGIHHHNKATVAGFTIRGTTQQPVFSLSAAKPVRGGEPVARR